MCFGDSLSFGNMESLSNEADIQHQAIEELGNSEINIDSAAFEIQDISGEDHEELQEMDDIGTHSVGRSRRRSASMSPNEDIDFTPSGNSTEIMTRSKRSLVRGPAARTRSKSQSTKRSASIKPNKTRQRSKTRKSSSGRQQGKGSTKIAKSRSRSRKPATRGRRARM